MMLKGAGDRCSFSFVCRTMFHILHRGVSIQTCLSVAICNAHFCLNGTHIYDDKYKMYIPKCSGTYMGQLQLPIAMTFCNIIMLCRSILVIMGVQWTQFIERTLCAQKAQHGHIFMIPWLTQLLLKCSQPEEKNPFPNLGS